MAIVESFFNHAYDTDVESNYTIYTIPNYDKSNINYAYTASVVTFVNNLCSLINQTEISYIRESDNCINIFGVKYYFDGSYDNGVKVKTEYHSFSSNISISTKSDVYPNSCFYKLRVVTNGESYFIIECVHSSSLANGNDTNSYSNFLYVMKCNFYDDSEAILTLDNIWYQYSSRDTITNGFLVDPNAEDYYVSLNTDFGTVNKYGRIHFSYSPFSRNRKDFVNSDYVNTYNLAHSIFPTKYNTTDKVLLQPLTLWNNYAYVKNVYIYPATTYSYTSMIVNFNNEEYYIPSCAGTSNIVPICFKL